MKIAVLGGGVVGVANAYYLARAGHEVTVLESREGAGLETSFANAGLVTTGHAEAWAGPGVPWKVLKGLGREDSPVLMRLRADPRMWAWCWRFLRNCSAEKWWRHSLRSLRLAVHSLEALRELRSETGIAYEERRRGLLLVSRDPKALEGWMQALDMAREGGVAGEALDGPACEKVEPALRTARERVCGGLHYPDDESGDCHLFTQRLAEHCRGLGVQFRYETSVAAIPVSGGRVEGLVLAGKDAAAKERGREPETFVADHYILAAGPQSPLLAAPLGIRLPIYPLKGYSVTFPTDGSERIPSMSLSDQDHRLGVSRLGDRLRVAGTAEFAGYDTRISHTRSRAVLQAALELVPEGLDSEGAEFWCGLRPSTPDSLPILGPTKLANLSLNTGHGTMGWTMACGSGKILADLISGKQPELHLDDYALARF